MRATLQIKATLFQHAGQLELPEDVLLATGQSRPVADLDSQEIERELLDA